MPEFLTLISPQEALTKLLDQVLPLSDVEVISTASACGRILSCAYHAPHPMPAFPRSTVDGYAVRARDTYGSGESLPAYLKVVGEVPMGAAPNINIGLGECAIIHTGGMLPFGADSIVMLEHSQCTREAEVEVYRAVAIGENIIKIGEDVQQGEEVISAGTMLHPAEIGGLMALGITQVEVIRKPSVAIISSGDEIIYPESPLSPGKVRDINGYSLMALVEEAGGKPVYLGIVPDKEDELFHKAAEALDKNDMLVITAGSSASTRDLTSGVMHRLGKPGVLVHGVNVKPGKPTILGICNRKPVIGLPGNPVSALVIASLFIKPTINQLLGGNSKPITWAVTAKLMVNLVSQAGREDWVPVRLVLTDDGFEADPIFGKSNLIFSLVRADGFICIPMDANGLSAGELVHVIKL